ncbi:MAG: hypothetical protein M0Z36_09855 [Thermaerobacter sp.]|nr:hypothetical protein [Thermaerobacter sp.]
MATSLSWSTWQAPSRLAEARERLVQATPHSSIFSQARREWRLDDYTDTRWADTPFPCDLCGRVKRGALRYRWVHIADPLRALWVDRSCALRIFVYPQANTRKSRASLLDRYTHQLEIQHFVAHCAEACLQDALSADEQRQWQRQVARRFRLPQPLTRKAVLAVWDALSVWCAILPPDDDLPLSSDERDRVLTALCTPPVVERRTHAASW